MNLTAAASDGYDDGMDTGPAMSSDDGDSDEEMTDTEPASGHHRCQWAPAIMPH